MKEDTKNFYETRSKVIAKAWKDPSFKQKLLKDPKAALKEMGCHIPEKMTVKCVEESKSTLTFVLPAAPAETSHLSEAELSKVAGGISEVSTRTCPEEQR
jgi:hypothetical protein